MSAKSQKSVCTVKDEPVSFLDPSAFEVTNNQKSLVQIEFYRSFKGKLFSNFRQSLARLQTCGRDGNHTCSVLPSSFCGLQRLETRKTKRRNASSDDRNLALTQCRNVLLQFVTLTLFLRESERKQALNVSQYVMESMQHSR